MYELPSIPDDKLMLSLIYAGVVGLCAGVATDSFLFFFPFSFLLLCPDQSEAEWHSVFMNSAVIYLLGATFYAIAASGELQAWAVDPLHVEAVPLESDSETSVLLHPTDNE